MSRHYRLAVLMPVRYHDHAQSRAASESVAEVAEPLLVAGVWEELASSWAGCRYLGSMALKLVLFGSVLWAFLALSQRSKERAGQKAAELFTAQELSRSDPPRRPENGRLAGKHIPCCSASWPTVLSDSYNLGCFFVCISPALQKMLCLLLSELLQLRCGCSCS